MKPLKPQVRYYVAEGFTGVINPRPGDAGYDLVSGEERVIMHDEQLSIKTGLHLGIPDEYFAMIRDRSSLALKKVRVQAGIIDPSFRGEVEVILHNQGLRPYSIKPGDRIAQLVFLPLVTPVLKQVTDIKSLPFSLRGRGGFGSTGE